METFAKREGAAQTRQFWANKGNYLDRASVLEHDPGPRRQNPWSNTFYHATWSDDFCKFQTGSLGPDTNNLNDPCWEL